MIADSTISFVVQGPVIKEGENTTKEVLNSIRKNFPNSEIILSTWKNEAVDGLECDQVVFSDLPDSLNLYTGHQCNINRQIVSTLNGIHAASNKYLVKTRTNTLFTGNEILAVYHNEQASVFKQLVYTIDLFSRDQYKSSVKSFHDGFLHHPSDIFLLGLKEDIEQLFSCEMATKALMLNKGGLGILAPEQYLWMNLLIRKQQIKDYKNSLVKYNPEACYKSEKLLFENFRVYHFETLGVRLENRLINGWMADTVITEAYQKEIDALSASEREKKYAARAAYYCLINNHFWRKVKKSYRRKVNKYLKFN